MINKSIFYVFIIFLIFSCKTSKNATPWIMQPTGIPFREYLITHKISFDETNNDIYDTKYYDDFRAYETKNGQESITYLKVNVNYYANDFLVDSNLGNKNFKNRFSFNIIKIDKLKSRVAFASIYYFEDNKLNMKKINLDSLFLNAEHHYVKIKGNTMIFPKGKIKYKRSFFDFATPSVSKYGGEKFKTKNYKYVYDSIHGFIINKNYLNN